jgi:hypothetical protein
VYRGNTDKPCPLNKEQLCGLRQIIAAILRILHKTYFRFSVDSYSAELLKSWVKEKFLASIITLDGAEFSAPSALTLRIPRKCRTEIYFANHGGMCWNGDRAPFIPKLVLMVDECSSSSSGRFTLEERYLGTLGAFPDNRSGIDF